MANQSACAKCLPNNHVKLYKSVGYMPHATIL